MSSKRVMGSNGKKISPLSRAHSGEVKSSIREAIGEDCTVGALRANASTLHDLLIDLSENIHLIEASLNQLTGIPPEVEIEKKSLISSYPEDTIMGEFEIHLRALADYNKKMDVVAGRMSRLTSR